ncbi:MAG: hypothetical protein AAFZ89_15030 [Bacteroidota bacterium]
MEGDSTGVGGKGCWVHHHPNDQDFVITPKNWGRNPDPYRKRIIEDAMEAISKSKVVYQRYGKLENKHFYILDNVRHTFVNSDGEREIYLGELVNYVNDECWLRTGIPTMRELSREERKQVFAHEVGHCFNRENSAPYRASLLKNSWIDESVAEYLSAMVYPRADYEHEWSIDFDLDGKAFMQPYAAYPLWQYYATEKGLDKVVPLMTSIASIASEEDRLNYLKRIGFDRIYHHFIFDFLLQNVKDAGGGVIPRETLTYRRPPFVVDPGAPKPLTLENIPSARNSLYKIVVPPGYDITLEPPVYTTSKVYFSILSDDKKVKEWTAPQKILGSCEGESSLTISVTHLNSDAIKDVTIRFVLNERTGCCDEDMVMTKNPPAEEWEGVFTFDYHITSTLRNVTADGDNTLSPMNYYVNSKDGSMIFPEGFFLRDLGKEKFGGMEFKAVVWFPNAQLVAYVIDPLGVKRAITMDMNQTASDIGMAHTFGAKPFLKNALGSGMAPALLPDASPWHGKAVGYAYTQSHISHPTKQNRITGYISKERSKVKSAMPFLGFMVGFIKDQENIPKKLVYAKYDDESGNTIAAHLGNIDRQCFTFDALGYTKMTLFGDVGGLGNMTDAEADAFDNSMEKLQNELLEITTQFEKCRGDKGCEAALTKRMIGIQNELMGTMYDLPSNPMYSGTVGSDLNEKLRVLDNKAKDLILNVIDKEVECDTYDQALRDCEKRGGKNCREIRALLRKCKDELEVIGKQIDKIHCEKAKIMGTEDLLGDCE